MKTIRIKISGVVQGVGFRYFTEKLAKSYDLTGWVRNNPDLTVEMIVSGQETLVDQFTNQVIQGNQFSRVEGVEIKSLPARSFDSFEIIYA